jgi:hypothetical protein
LVPQLQLTAAVLVNACRRVKGVHLLHITLENAYHGLAGFMLMSDQLKHGGCGAPYNLEVQAKGQLLYHWLQHQIETLPEC